MTWTRPRVIGLLLLFSAGSLATGAVLLATRREPARPAAGQQSGTGTVLGGTPQAPAGDAATGVFTISGRVAGLLPGQAGTLRLRVTNPNAYPIQVLTLDTRVTEPAGCPAGSLTVGRYAYTDGPAFSAPANGTVDVEVPALLADSPTQDQSRCAGVPFPLAFTGTAVQAR